MNEPVSPDPRAADERRLVEGLLRREDRAVREFLERTHHPVYCLAFRFARDPSDRQDWTHDVLLGILEDLDRGRFEYRGPGTFWAWFRKRAHYRLLDQVRRARRIAEREAPGGGADDLAAAATGAGPGAWPAPGPGEDPWEELRRAEIQAALEACLEGLGNADHRRSLELLLYRDLTYEAIAAELRTPLNTIRAWIRRGRLALRRCLVATLDLAPGAQPSGGAGPSSPRRRSDR